MYLNNMWSYIKFINFFQKYFAAILQNLQKQWITWIYFKF